MNEEKKYEQIQSYLSGTLTEPEHSSFEQELANSSTLQEEMDLHLLSNDAIDLVVEDDLRAELNNLAQQNKQKKNENQGGRVVSMRRRIYTLSIAASILLVIGFFTATFQASKYDNDSIASGYYSNDLLERVRGANSASLLQEGMDFLLADDYSEAIGYFDQVTDPALIAEAHYGAAHAHYNLENYQAAMTNFANVVDSKDPRFKEKAELFYVLSALAADQMEDDRFNTLFDKLLSDEGHYAHKDILEINKKLKSFWRNFDF